MYAMLSTQHDVALALSLTSHYQNDPGISHWNVVKGILKYLRNTKDMVTTRKRLIAAMALVAKKEDSHR
jgi:hypothetical protein